MSSDSKSRKLGVLFIQEAGVKLEFPVQTTSAAAVLFHRFFLKRSFQEFDKFLIATTCLYLAAKLEESPKRLRDVINTTFNLQHKTPIQIGQEYWELRDSVVAHEQIVVRTLAFELTVQQPYKHLMNYASTLRAPAPLLQTAWNVMNDSFCTLVCIDFQPHEIAAASLFLAAKLLQFELPSGRRAWWEVFETTTQTLERISHQILDMYEIPTSS
eukprot:TRINITY_DN3565_c0_g2_i1.p1 TRINITY_DN3565_c0_g2~~TRINITY_DN3565_c0_g2_i1.p1  ORF type:complete len:214 (+),score=23.35 TRINITY_DN3565_c0_g2_i1:429-1070(+)